MSLSPLGGSPLNVGLFRADNRREDARGVTATRSIFSALSPTPLPRARKAEIFFPPPSLDPAVSNSEEQGFFSASWVNERKSRLNVRVRVAVGQRAGSRSRRQSSSPPAPLRPRPGESTAVSYIYNAKCAADWFSIPGGRLLFTFVRPDGFLFTRRNERENGQAGTIGVARTKRARAKRS